MSASNGTERGRYVVVVAIDESATAIHVVDAAVAQARAHEGAEIHLVHAQTALPVRWISDDAVVGAMREAQRKESWKLMEKPLERARQICGGGKVTAHLGTGDPTRVVLSVASKLEADLLVVGTHDYHGAARFILGSIAEILVRKAQCPVLVVRPTSYQSDFVSDIEPPCSECSAIQRTSRGENLWCEKHQVSHNASRHEHPETLGREPSLLRY